MAKNPTIRGPGPANKPTPEELRIAKDLQLRALYTSAEDYEPRNSKMIQNIKLNKERPIPYKIDPELPARTRFGMILTWTDPFFFIRIL